MSICCNIAIEFQKQLSADESIELQAAIDRTLLHFCISSEPLTILTEDSLIVQMYTYSGYSVDDAGNLSNDIELDKGKPCGCGYGIPARAFGIIKYHTRWWSESYPEGPLPIYVVTMLTLLASPLVKRVWYFADDVHTASPVTREKALDLLEKYISHGIEGAMQPCLNG
ncbi:TPA: hypothetical protein L4559_005118 [Pseudomonas aeruginosa]|nr:hypothetical protein [Pseudomonas aeruginosa]